MAGYSITYQAVEAFIEPASAGAAFASLFDERDTTDLHADIGEHLVDATGERFEAERAPDGAPWAPLSPATLISGYRKRAKGNRAFKSTGRGPLPVRAGMNCRMARRRNSSIISPRASGDSRS